MPMRFSRRIAHRVPYPVLSLATVAIVCAMSVPAASHAADALTVNAAVAASVAQAKPRRYALPVPAGHVVQGVFEGRQAILDVQDASGHHLRRLADGASASTDFMFIAGAQGVSQFVVAAQPAATPAPFRLTISRIVAPAQPSSASAPSVLPAALALPSPRLRALAAHVARNGDTDAFWREVERLGTPLIEPLNGREAQVTFLWRGARHNVRLFGSPSGDHDALQRLGATDVWWSSYRMPTTARLSYLLAPDVPDIIGTPLQQRRMILTTAQRDPLNRHAFPAPGIDLFQGRSIVTLPDAPEQTWVKQRAQVASGSIRHHAFSSRILGNMRDIWIYRPAKAAPQALLVLFDAPNYVRDVPTPTILDNLVAEGRIPPTAAIFIGNPSAQARGAELPPNPDFAKFLAEELMPWVRAQGLSAPAAKTVIAGSSYGGLASAYVALVHPDIFGNVLSLSGSFWWAPQDEVPNWLARQYAALPVAPLRLYLDAGRYEGGRNGRAGILETNRDLGQVLRAKGYPLIQREHDSGHDYLHWQGSLGCGLVALLGEGIDGLPQCQGIASAAAPGSNMPAPLALDRERQ